MLANARLSSCPLAALAQTPLSSLDVLWNHPLLRNGVATVALMVLLLLLRWVLRQRVLQADIRSPDLRRRWIVQIRSLCAFLFVLGVTIIWASELQAFALSVVAVLVALVLATKELILCLTGSLLKVGAHSFGVGDRIQVGEWRGEVVDQTLLSTRLMEVGPDAHTHQFTGRMITLPNSLFLTTPIANESLSADYLMLNMSFTLKCTEDWAGAEQFLREAAGTLVEPYRQQVEQQIGRTLAREGMIGPTLDPQITLVQPNADEVTLLLRLPAPDHERWVIEQQLRRQYLQWRRAAVAG